MNPQIQILIFLAQIAALWAFVVFAVKDYALDRLRQNLFGIRAAMFDKVVEEKGNFDDIHYRNLRAYVNQVIRRGHMVTLSQSLIAEVISRVPFITGGVSPAEMREYAEESLKQLDETYKGHVIIPAPVGPMQLPPRNVRSRVHEELCKYSVLTSPLFFTALVILIPVVTCLVGYIGFKRLALEAYDRYFARDFDRGISGADCDAAAA